MQETEEHCAELMKSIGFGRSMQLAQEKWRDMLLEQGLEGGEFGIHTCVAFLVPCPGCPKARDKGEHCDWCCGSGHVTERVAQAVNDEAETNNETPRQPVKADGAGRKRWRI